MNRYIERLDDQLLYGIKTVFWRDFLRTFQESTADDEAHEALRKLRTRVERSDDRSSAAVGPTLAIINELETLLGGDA